MYILSRFFVMHLVQYVNETHKKIDRDKHASGQGLLRSVDSFRGFEYCAYLACCFVQIFHGIEVVSVYMVHVMELHVDSLIDGMEKCEIVPIWLKQRC